MEPVLTTSFSHMQIMLSEEINGAEKISWKDYFLLAIFKKIVYFIRPLGAKSD
jgi:hypothetical protein